eukprot:85794_1
MAHTYFNARSKNFIILVGLCGGCYPALSMVSSGVFGSNHFNSGLTSHELKALNKIKVRGTIWAENIPQLLIQAMYAAAIGNVTSNTGFSLCASALSIVITLTLYCFDKSNENITTFTYYLELNKKRGKLSDDE